MKVYLRVVILDIGADIQFVEPEYETRRVARFVVPREIDSLISCNRFEVGHRRQEGHRRLEAEDLVTTDESHERDDSQHEERRQQHE